MRKRSTQQTACPLDCPDACSLVAEVEDGRLVALDGDERNRLTGGLICGKVRRIDRHLYGSDRLLRPAIRRGAKGEGAFEPVTWDVALDRIATRFLEIARTFGGEAILPFAYGGSNGLFSDGSIDERLFRRLGTSALARTVCAAPSSRAAEGLYGKMPGVDLSDYAHASLIVLWGVNPSASGIHLVPIIKAAQRGGAKLIVVDPRRTPLAANADLHLAIRPGTDLAVALALTRWLFEHGHADLAFLDAHATGADQLRAHARQWTVDRAANLAGIAPAALQRLAQMYAQASPAVIRCGWGPERNRNGGSATASILALPAVAGKFGVRGGGYTMSNSKAFVLDRDAAVAEPEPPVRTINMNHLGRVLTEPPDPPIKGVFSYNCNPLATMPNQGLVRRGLLREDLFTVVFDQVMTDTARYADVLLPATTFLEHDDLATGYGAMVLNRIRPVIDRVGEARPNHEVFAELVRRCGVERPGDPVTPDELEGALVRRAPDGQRLAADLHDRGSVEFCRSSPHIQFVDVFPRTADRKIHLCPEDLDREAKAASPGGEGLYRYRPNPVADPAFPLALVSPATAKTVSSTFGQLVPGRAALRIHPDDARSRGIDSGNTIRVFNRLGEVVCLAVLDDAVRPGVVDLPKGLWCKHAFNGNTANVLAPDHLADLGGGATFNDAQVEVELKPADKTAP